MTRLHTALILCLALAGFAHAAPYRIAGATERGESYAGRGEARPAAGGLLVERATDSGRLRGRLQWTDGAWRGPLLGGPGARGRLLDTGGASLEATVTETAQGYRLRWVDPQGNRGEEEWRGALPTPRDLDPLALDVFAQAVDAAERGVVPADRMVSDGNRVDPHLLESGPEIFGAAGELIASAEREVLIQTYYWKTPCQAGDAIFAGLKALEERRRAAQAEAPVDVFFVINKHFTTRSNVKNLERDVAQAGFDPRLLNVRVAPFKQRIFGNLHTKAFVVDGERAILTSANVHPPQDAPTPWYEIGAQLAGPVCASLRAEFAQLWERATGDAFPGQRLPLPAAFPDGVPVALVSRPSEGNPFRRRMDDPAGVSYTAAIRGAQRRIRILTPHLADATLRSELEAALRRGVEVQLVVSKGMGKLRASLPGQGGTNAKNVAKLREALADDPGALARFQPRWFSQDGELPQEGNGAGVNHAKFLSVDGELVIVGSSNHDTQALKYSREVNVVVADSGLTQAWEAQVFEPAFARGIAAD
ncbi:MAG: phosphatidylserine/phosphatidylglycerophosphate/cardiolipin synthase family protein [Planctomycetota bacterium]